MHHHGQNNSKYINWAYRPLRFFVTNEIFRTERVLHLNVRYQFSKNYPFVIYALRCWPEKASWFLSISLLVELGCHCISSFSFVLRESYVLFFKKWRVNTRFSSSWLHHKPTFCGHDPMARRRSKRGEFFSLIIILRTIHRGLDACASAASSVKSDHVSRDVLS